MTYHVSLFLQASVVLAAAGGAGGGGLRLPRLLRFRPLLHRRLPARPATVVQQGCGDATTSAERKMQISLVYSDTLCNQMKVLL